MADQLSAQSWLRCGSLGGACNALPTVARAQSLRFVSRFVRERIQKPACFSVRAGQRLRWIVHEPVEELQACAGRHEAAYGTEGGRIELL